MLLRRRRRGRRLVKIEHSKNALGARQFAFAVEVQKDEQKREMDSDHRRNGTAAIPIADVRSVGHDLSTPVKGPALRIRKERRSAGTLPALVPITIFSGSNCSCGHRRGSPFRPCSQFRAALRDPSRQIRASILRSWSLPCFVSKIADWRACNANGSSRFIMLMEVRNG
jgi:hypothetical protein